VLRLLSAQPAATPDAGDCADMDIIVLAMAVGFFGLMFGYIGICEKL
jgi:hypothetical protein